MINRRFLFAPALLMLCAVASMTAAEDWTRFRGANGAGVADGESLPSELGPTTNVEWKTAVPPGRSSPVVQGDHLYLTAADQALLTLAYDRKTGKELWRRSVERRFPMETAPGTTDSAMPTPVTDGPRVFSFFPEYGAVAYSSDGEELWHLPLGPHRNYYGIAASPVLFGDALILICDQPQGAFALALDKRTGKELWRRDRLGESWTTPVVVGSADQAILVVLGTASIDAYHLPAGKPAWRFAGVGYAPVSSPLLYGNTLIVNTPDQSGEGMPTFVALRSEWDHDKDGRVAKGELEGPWAGSFGWLDVDSNGFLTEAEYNELYGLMNSDAYGLVALQLSGNQTPKELWRERKNLANISTPLVYRDVLYTVRQGGILNSYDPATGQLHKRARLSKAVDDYFPSLVAGDGKIFVASNSGQLIVLKAGAEWEVESVNDLDQPIFATPAIAGGAVLVRTGSQLYSFRQATAKD